MTETKSELGGAPKLGGWLRCVALLYWFLGSTAIGQTVQVPLTSAFEVHSLSEAEARTGRPVRFRAVVTFYDPKKADSKEPASLFVQDATGGVFVAIPPIPVLAIREGTQVEVSGVTGTGDFAPIVTQSQVRILGQGRAPANPPRVTMTQLATGAFDCDWVEIEGIVHSATRVGRMESFRISTRDGPLTAMTLARDDVDSSRWMDTRVRVRGVPAVDYNKHLQMTGIHLFFSGEKDLRVLREAQGDAFQLPVRTIDRLARFDPSATVTERVHIRGTVTLDWPDRLLCVQDLTGGLCVQYAASESFEAGSLVDIVGYPVFAAEVPALTDAAVRRIGGPARSVALQQVNAADIFERQYSGELVGIEGTLVGLGSDGRNWFLSIVSKGVIFTAIVPRSPDASASRGWQQGSYVSVVGVCVNEMEAQANHDWTSLQRMRAFRILMSESHDVKVLRTPSWWTPTHSFTTLGAVILLTLAVFCWVVLLRRQVDQRTEELRESERRFRHLAHHDSLTGVPNRAWFHERAEMALALSRRSGEAVGMLLLDLDQFKPVNDTLGHDAGDAMLCALAQRVSRFVRKVDTVARLGGDEFAVVLVGVASADDVERSARKILAAVCQPVAIKEQMVQMSASIGFAVFPEDGDSVMELLRSADLAMYESKKLQRGGVRRWRREVTIEEVEEIAGLVGFN